MLQVIADFTGLNIITSDTVTGSLTLRLKDIPWDQALDIIMQTKGLDMRKNGNVVLIAPREELAVKEKQQLEAQLQISELEPLITESFQLNYMKAQDLSKSPVDQQAAAVRPRRRPDGDDGRAGFDHFQARRGVSSIRARTSSSYRTPQSRWKTCVGSSANWTCRSVR